MSGRSLPPSPSWRAILTRSPGGGGTAGPRRRPPFRRAMEDDDDHQDEQHHHNHKDHEMEGEHRTFLSTSSVGRNQLPFLRLLNPTTTASGNALYGTSSNYGGRRASATAATASAGTTTSSPPRTTITTQQPFLIIALRTLNDALPEFCRLLSDPTQAAKACAVLDASVATAGSNSPSSTRRATSPLHAGTTGTHPAPSSSSSHPARTTATTTTTSSSTSPASGGTSPIMSNLLQWLTSTSEQAHSRFKGSGGGSGFGSTSDSHHRRPSSPTPSALALEGEWEPYVAPLFLLAAAEAWYADLKHVEDSGAAGHHNNDNNDGTHESDDPSPLALLYRRISTDLTLVKDVLCGPFLLASSLHGISRASSDPISSSPLPSPPQSSPSTLSQSVAAAKSLASTLDGLSEVCACRVQLIEAHGEWFASSGRNGSNGGAGGTSTFGSQSSSNAAVALRSVHSGDGFTTPSLGSSRSGVLAEGAALVATLGRIDSAGSDASDNGAQPLRAALKKECKNWEHCLEAALALDRCRFMDAILSLRRWKLVLPESKNPSPRLTLWFHATLDHYTSLLPIYFDRVQTTSAPLYGFDSSLLLQGKHVTVDWNGPILDVLRRQEKIGVPMAVALVLDAVQSGTFHVQRGVQFSATAPDGGEGRLLRDGIPLDDARIRWPAVYLRSTLHLNAAPARPSMSQTGAAPLNGSQSNLLHNWAVGGSSSSPVSSSTTPEATKVPLAFTKATVLEYPPDAGAAAWPHSEWPRLSMMLLNPQRRPLQQFAITVDRTSSLSRSGSLASAVTYRDPPQATASPTKPWPARDSLMSLEEAASLFGSRGSLDNLSSKSSFADRRDGKAQGPQHPSSNSYHLVQVSACLHLVAIVGGDEADHRWHRRRTSLSDPEIRTFLMELAAHWSVHEPFAAHFAPRPSREILRLSLSQFRSRQDEIWEEWPGGRTAETSQTAPKAFPDDRVPALLKEVKLAFGLRPASCDPLVLGGGGIGSGSALLRSYGGSTLSPASRLRLQQAWRSTTMSSTTAAASISHGSRGPSSSSPRDYRRSRGAGGGGPSPWSSSWDPLPLVDESAHHWFLGTDLAARVYQ